jgi:hypothetical protein
MSSALDYIDRQLASIHPGIVKVREPLCARDRCKTLAKEIIKDARVAENLSLRDHSEQLELKSHKTIDESEKFGKRLEALVDLMMAEDGFYVRVIDRLNRWRRLEREQMLNGDTCGE